VSAGAQAKREPHACSLSPGELSQRGAEIRALADSALVDRERRDGVVALTFRGEPAVQAAVEDLARRERQCCPFLDIDVGDSGGRVTLTIAAEPEDAAALDAFYELAG
jgi:hypothetical protein